MCCHRGHIKGLALVLISTLLFLQMPLHVTAQECLPPIGVSVVEVPVRASLEEVISDIERKVPVGEDYTGAKTTTGRGCILHLCGDLGYTWRWRRDPFRFVLSENSITVIAKFYYGAEGFVCVPNAMPIGARCFWKSGASCGMGSEPMRGVAIEATTRVSLTPNYGLSADVTVKDPVLDPCNLTFLDINVAPVLSLLVRQKLNEVKGMLESYVRGINFEADAQRAWARLQQPIGTGTPEDWLIVNPLEVSADPLTGSGAIVNTKLRLSGIMQMVRGGAPDSSLLRPRPLPRLGGARPASGIKLYMAGSLSFEEANSSFRARLVGKRFTTAVGEVTISDAYVSGRAENAQAHIRVAGELQGSITATGRIVFRQADRTMRVTGLMFSGKADNEMTQVLFEQLLQDPQLTSFIQDSLVWELGPEIDRLQVKVQRALNSPLGGNISVSGNVTIPQSIEIFAVPKSAVFPEAGEAREARRPEGNFNILLSAGGTACVSVGTPCAPAN
jgi:hypothetical protein